MRKLRQLFFGLFAFALLISCSEEIKPTPYTYTKLFTGENNKTWKIRYYEYTIDGDVEERFNVDCSADDEYTFYANPERSYEVDTGNNRCNDGELGLIVDTWSFTNATATLTMIMPAFTNEFGLPFIVRDVDDDDLEIELFLDQENTESYRIHLEAIDED